jgi:hypothetical protein
MASAPNSGSMAAGVADPIWPMTDLAGLLG